MSNWYWVSEKAQDALSMKKVKGEEEEKLNGYRSNMVRKLKKKTKADTPWRHLGGEEVYSCYSFSTSALDGG
jgi:hypothetical protein